MPDHHMLRRGSVKTALNEAALAKFEAEHIGDVRFEDLEQLLHETFPDLKQIPFILQKIMQMLVETDPKVTSASYGQLRAFFRFKEPDHAMMTTRSALIIINVQNDYVSGPFACGNGDAPDIVPLINRMRDRVDLIVIANDWHPQEHCSFLESVNSGQVEMADSVHETQVGAVIALLEDRDRPSHMQRIFPRHCVQDTFGASSFSKLAVRPTDKMVYMGTKPNLDGLSAFYDNLRAKSTGLSELLNETGITDLYLVGLPLDQAVLATAIHGAELGFKMTVVKDACRAYRPDSDMAVQNMLRFANVDFITTEKAIEVETKRRKDGQRQVSTHLKLVRMDPEATRFAKGLASASFSARAPVKQEGGLMSRLIPSFFGGNSPRGNNNSDSSNQSKQTVMDTE